MSRNALSRRSSLRNADRKNQAIRNRVQESRFRLLRLEQLEDRRMLSIDFPGFSDATGLNLVGEAAIAEGNVLRLTPAAGGLKGAAWFATDQQFASADFETIFEYELSERVGGPPGGDGFAFVIQNSSDMALGGGASGLGIQRDHEQRGGRI